jgi:hypothetical protein
MNRRAMLARALREPLSCLALGREAWQDLVWQARSAELMAQLHGVLLAAGLLEQIPAAARRHLALAAAVAQRHQRAVASELRSIAAALAPLQLPVLLLKGAAYGVQGLKASDGRIYNDIDLMVPKAHIDAVELQLSHAGYIGQHLNAYDQRYYRVWMHEIPPMEHKNRGSVLDVHHTILPPTSGLRPDPARLIEGSRPAPGEWSAFRVLAPADQVLHSAVHLFLGEFHKGLRDLFDLHRLLTEFGEGDGFWSDLQARAALHGLELPLSDALTQSERLYGTRLPQALLAALRERGRSRWPMALRNWLFDHALRPPHPSGGASKFALWLVFLRSHWLRMPLPLLAYHLTHKAVFPDG